MQRREIRTKTIAESCDICGRTLLPGESAETYLAGGSRRAVCELCAARAVNEGWIRESASSGELPARRPAGNGRRSLFGGRRQRRERPGEPVEGLEGEETPADAPEAPESPYALPESAREPRHVHAVPTNDDLKMARAVELFNASDHRRKVGGVARSLGMPWISVRPTLDEPSVVRIVVAWELSWYRFEVDLSDEAGGVRQAGQGTELSELNPDEQGWNGASDDAGELQLLSG
jgi:hypothetical protein